MLLTHDGDTYAVISFADSDNTFGLFLVVSDDAYQAHAEYFCR